jgi:hypothetical protein
VDGPARARADLPGSGGNRGVGLGLCGDRAQPRRPVQPVPPDYPIPPFTRVGDDGSGDEETHCFVNPIPLPQPNPTAAGDGDSGDEEAHCFAGPIPLPKPNPTAAGDPAAHT